MGCSTVSFIIRVLVHNLGNFTLRGRWRGSVGKRSLHRCNVKLQDMSHGRTRGGSGGIQVASAIRGPNWRSTSHSLAHSLLRHCVHQHRWSKWCCLGQSPPRQVGKIRRVGQWGSMPPHRCGIETGGRWSNETLDFVAQAAARSRASVATIHVPGLEAVMDPHVRSFLQPAFAASLTDRVT